MKKKGRILLSNHWKIQSSEHIAETGEILSTSFQDFEEWIPAKVPSTVLATLVENNQYKDPYFGENLKTIPTDPFKVPWWYVNTFELKAEEAEQFASLVFDGINYKANVWLNGQKVAGIDEIDGAYRRTRFDISSWIQAGENQLAIEVIPPVPGDFSTGFVDWNPAPPDGNLGIFRPVTLHLHGGVRIEEPFVRTSIDFDEQVTARLQVSAEIANDQEKSITGVLKGKIGDIHFEQQISLAAGESKQIEFGAEEYEQLILKDPKLWWPYQMGEPYLYLLDLSFEADEDILDTALVRFGVREVEDYWVDDTHRGYKINGERILIKGAGWTDDMLLMDTDETIEAQVKYVKHMNMNCIRLEGFFGKDHKLYDLCDEYGILLMAGWSCHWEHEIHMGVPVNERFGGVYKPEHIEHIAKAWEEQVVWLRNHPSIFVWAMASDKIPITELEERYIEILERIDPDRPHLNSTGGVGSDQHVIGPEDVISEISGSSGMKMLGPYAYTAPHYWYTDTKFGGAYGFNTETGPGAQPPQLESLKKFIPEDKLWPINEVWDYHCGRYEFDSLDRFRTALRERYGEPESLEEFDRKAQTMNYELMRPMFEAFQVNREKATGVIQWMLNGAWPKMYWQLYDYYLNPNGAFYATKKSCTPLQLVYNYGNQEVYIVNEHLEKYENLRAVVRGYDIESQVLFEKTLSVDVDPDSSGSVFQIEEGKNFSTTWFLDLRLYDADDQEINNNFYWLSTKEEILDYEADLGDFAYHTPSKQYADLTLLNQLASTDVSIRVLTVEDGKQKKKKIILKNEGDSIAFMINLHLVDQNTGDSALPVFWDDNFISLLPGEERTVFVTAHSDVPLKVRAEGWNTNILQE